jgi:hypothetical protein
MKLQRALIVLTVVNLALLVFQLAQIRPVGAQEIAPVLRTQRLEIVDGQGTLRARLMVGDTEETILSMADKHGQVRVKLGAKSEGSGFTLFNNAQAPGIQMQATGTGSVIAWEDNTGRSHAVKESN